MFLFSPRQESPHGDGSEKEDGDSKEKEVTSPSCPAEVDSDLEDSHHSPCGPDDDIIPDSDDDEIDVENETGCT